MSRLLLLSHDLSGNAAWTPWQFAGALGRLGHESVIAGPSTGPLWPALAAELSIAERLSGRWPDAEGRARAEALARDVDAIWAFKAIPSSLGLALRLGRRVGRPVLLHLDDRDAAYLDDRPWFARLRFGVRALGNPVGRFALLRAERRIGDVDALTVSTRALQAAFGGTLVPQGIDEAAGGACDVSREEARIRLGIDPAEDFALFAGSPSPHKGLPELASLVDAGLPVRIVGAPASALRAAGVGDALLSRIRHAPPAPIDEVGLWIRACTVFVVPQRDTPFARWQLPAKILHATMLGRAVVASDVADASLLLGGSPPAGRVVPAGDPAAFARAVAELFSDPEARTALESEALRRARAEWGWTAMAHRIAGVLEGVGITDSRAPEGGGHDAPAEGPDT